MNDEVTQYRRLIYFMRSQMDTNIIQITCPLEVAKRLKDEYKNSVIHPKNPESGFVYFTVWGLE